MGVGDPEIGEVLFTELQRSAPASPSDELIWSRPEATLPYLQHQAERL